MITQPRLWLAGISMSCLTLFLKERFGWLANFGFYDKTPERIHSVTSLATISEEKVPAKSTVSPNADSAIEPHWTSTTSSVPEISQNVI